jgi:hypothetical protein
MLPIFNGQDAAQIRILSTEISKSLKEKHNISLKVSKVLNLLSTINGFNNWHTYNAYLEDNPTVDQIVSQYEHEFEELLSDSVKLTIPKNINIEKNIDLTLESVSNSPEELFKYLSNVSILDSSISKDFTDSLSPLNALCHVLYGETKVSGKPIKISRLKHVSTVQGFFESSEQHLLDDKYLIKIKRLINKLPGYTEEDAIMGQLSSSVSIKIAELLQDMDKLIDILESRNRLPVIEIINSYYHGNKMHIIGQKIIAFMLPDLNISKDEYQNLEDVVIRENINLCSDKTYAEMEVPIKMVILLDEYHYKNERCIVAQKNILF